MSNEMLNGRELPEGWQRVKLGDKEVGITTSGGTPDRTKAEYFGGHIKWVKSGELNDDWIYDTEEKISEDGLRNSAAKIFPVGTLLIALYGATAGKTAVLQTEAATNQAVCAIFPRDKAFDSHYMQFYLIYIRPAILNARAGGAQPNINQRVLNFLDVYLPPLPEQRAIAHALRTVQAAREARRREAALERERKAALMQRLFTQGTRGEPTKTTEIGEVPVCWEVVRLVTVARFESGGTPSKERGDWWQGSIPWVSPKDLNL